MTRLAWPMLAVAALLAALAAMPADITLSNPDDLTRHPEWIGREVTLESRVKFFVNEENGRYKELLLHKPDDVTFRLAPQLRPVKDELAEIRVVRLTGIPKREGTSWSFDVQAMTVLPRDDHRLEQAVRSLAPSNYKQREAWARWAFERAALFNDPALKARAETIAAEAIWVEADRSEAADKPALWISLAQRCRDLGLPEPEPSALAHRSFRARFDAAKTVADLTRLEGDIKAFLPGSERPVAADVDLSSWIQEYADRPGEAYRKAPSKVQAGLDRRLLADVIGKRLQTQASENPPQALTLAEEAKRLLPDRPELAQKLEAQGLEAATKDVGSLRQADMERLAQSYETRGQPEQARALKRQWLDDQRLHRLSDTDAESRVSLASQYNEMLGDRTMARALLVEALKIDSEYRAAEEALRQLGFKKVGEEWIDPAESRGNRAAESEGQPAASDGSSMIGLTRAEVRARYGKPDVVTRTASQAEILEQWIYRGVKSSKYINFVRRTDRPVPRVLAEFSLP